MPKVSIILPCYNVEKHLAQSIDSVLAQTHSNFELLVVIDGSPDNSKEIAEEYAVKDPRITVFDKPNGGLSDARNYGLERAQGEFIYFMDSDDWIEPDLLKDNLKIIAQENLNFIVFGYFADFKNTEEELTQQKNNKPKIETLKPSDNIDNYHLGILGYAWNKIYRKSFLDQHHFRFKKGISLIEDILFNAPIYQVSDIIRFNPHSYYHYIQREEETLVKKFYPDIFELQKMKIEVLEDWFTAWDISNKNEFLAQIRIGRIRGVINNLFSSNNNLSFKDKIKFIHQMYNDPAIKSDLKSYQPNSKKDYIYKFLVKHKMVWITAAMATLIK